MSRALAIVTAILTISHSYVFAQAPPCLSQNNSSSLYNSLSQTPCTMALALQRTCNNTSILPPLQPNSGNKYLPATFENDACHCSTVFYSLISACSFCQNGYYHNWTAYVANCTTTYNQVFINPIPTSIVVPHYAYLDVVTKNNFNVTAAENAGGPESSPVPQPTSSSIATCSSITITTVTVTATPTSGSVRLAAAATSNPGAIAGGVIGGVAFIGIVAFLLFKFKLRGRKRPAYNVISSHATGSGADGVEIIGLSSM